MLEGTEIPIGDNDKQMGGRHVPQLFQRHEGQFKSVGNCGPFQEISADFWQLRRNRFPSLVIY